MLVHVTRFNDVQQQVADLVDAELAGLFPGLKIDRSKPEPGTVLYTIPGTGSFDATVQLTFTPANGGQGSVISVAVDVPGGR